MTTMLGGILISILAISAGADDAPAAAAEIYRGDFEAAMDADYDGWPDDWLRRRVQGGPDFARIQLAPRPDGKGRALAIALGGGRTEVASPALKIDRLFSLVCEAEIACEKIERSEVRFQLLLLDEKGGVVDEKSTLVETTSGGFSRVQLGPIIPSAVVHSVQAVLQIAPSEGRGDLAGVVRVDNLRLLRLPRMHLIASEKLGLYTGFDAAEIRCELSGVSQTEPRVGFELLDYRDRVLQSEETPLKPKRKPVTEGTPTLAAPVRSASAAPREAYAATAAWRPKVPDYGFYRVRVTLTGQAEGGGRQTVLRRTVPLAVLRPFPRPTRGEFGWSLPAGEKPYGVGDLASIVESAGVNWVKYPLWFSDQDTARADRLAWFAERLSIQRIEMIGVLDQPPDELRSVFREPGRIPVASLFHDPQWWTAAIDPVLTRLSLKVRWWQLGDDQDASFVGLPDMPEKVQEIRRHMERFGQRVRVGVGWKWLWEAPPGEAAPWAFLTLSGQPDLTAAEIGEYLRTPPPANSSKPQFAPQRSRPAGFAAPADPARVGQSPQLPVARQFVSTDSPSAAAPGVPAQALRMLSLSPLPRGRYATDVRAADLAQRMLAAKIHGAGGVFVTQPFSDTQGLFDLEGSPTELFLPWRTTASLIAGTEYLGSLELEGEAVNHIFAGEQQAVLVLWSDEPTHETFFLGDDVLACDIWGRPVPIENDDRAGFRQHRVAVGPTPVFVLGVSPQLARWQIAARFERPAIDSIYGREQRVALTAPNAFGLGIGGQASLRAPNAWNIDALPQTFRAPAGETVRIAWPLILLADADSGLQRVTIDVSLSADKPYRFRLHRKLFLGLDDVSVQLRTRAREDGSLLVEQLINNLSERPLSFQCVLFPPGRRRESTQARDLPPGRSTVTFVLPNADELIGQKLYLRAEEIGGARVLNSSALVER